MMKACKVNLLHEDNLFMKPYLFFSRTLLLLAGISVLQLPAWANSSQISDVRLWTAPDHTRLVFDLNRTIEYRLFRLHEPERIVLDLYSARLLQTGHLGKLTASDPVIKTIRHGSSGDGTLRIVLDVKEAVKPRSFLLKPMHGKPHRLVVDLMRAGSEGAEESVVTADQVRSRKEIVIAVDAGHGGEDPGAIGKSGLQEKIVTLAVAKELAKAINARDGMRAVLIRKGDYFVALGQRVRLARRSRADLMISIHADAVKNRGVEGASVYTLSERGATPDKVAKALAARENAADAVGGFVSSEIDDPMVNMILGDMAKRDSLNSAYLLAETIIKDFGKVGPVKYDVPKRARFAVLGALEMPSVLVELDFISNPGRERMLRSSTHQKKMAGALLNASLTFLKRQGQLKQTAVNLLQHQYAGASQPGRSKHLNHSEHLVILHPAGERRRELLPVT
ncbi:MAG: N-acetylmuramoyl-L-alanine amidase [Mariprofundaceae bacterium]|nr:N-acetylmuramoyl-L-alanine amidase [Mariprofundaceae bacterium]